MDGICLIGIISLNQLEYTKRCVESILRNTVYPHSILIVDNGSDSQTIDVLKCFKEHHSAEVIFNKENLGWVKAVNQIMFHSDFPYVCIMNNDTLAYPGWLEEMINIAERDKRIGLVNPLWQLPKRFRGTVDDYFDKIVRNQEGEFIETDWVRGFCFLVKRAVIDKIGGLDEMFSPAYYDDWDYSVRAIKAGFRCVIAKGSFVYHYKNITYSDTLGKSGLNELIQEKAAVFYERWGRPLKILLIIDTSLRVDAYSLKDFLLHLLREQHKVYVIHQLGDFVVEHTNCIIRQAPIFIRSKSLLNILNNFRHSSTKRYDIILSSNKLNSFLSKLPFIKYSYMLKEIRDNLENREELLDRIADLSKDFFRKECV